MRKIKKIETPETFCYTHGEVLYNGKCARCIWASELTPNEISERAAAKTPEQQNAVLLAAIFGGAM